MCARLEICVKSGVENKYYLEDNLRCNSASYMKLNNATLIWNFKNVQQNVNDTLNNGHDIITFEEGYWTFNMIQDKLKKSSIILKYNAYDNTCKIYSDKALILNEFGVLLGFPTNRAVTAKSWATSTNAVDVNLGLRRVSLNCESINSA